MLHEEDFHEVTKQVADGAHDVESAALGSGPLDQGLFDVLKIVDWSQVCCSTPRQVEDQSLKLANESLTTRKLVYKECLFKHNRFDMLNQIVSIHQKAAICCLNGLNVQRCCRAAWTDSVIPHDHAHMDFSCTPVWLHALSHTSKMRNVNTVPRFSL